MSRQATRLVLVRLEDSLMELNSDYEHRTLEQWVSCGYRLRGTPVFVPPRSEEDGRGLALVTMVYDEEPAEHWLVSGARWLLRVMRVR